MAITVREGTRDNPKKKGYFTLNAETAEDVKKLRGSEIHKQIRRQGVESIAKQEEEQRQGEKVRYPNGMLLPLSTKVHPLGKTSQAEDAINYMRRNVAKGPPATRPTFTMPGYFKTMPDGSRKLVREGDPDY